MYFNGGKNNDIVSIDTTELYLARAKAEIRSFCQLSLAWHRRCISVSKKRHRISESVLKTIYEKGILQEN